METKYFKKIYTDSEGFGIWNEGDAINYECTDCIIEFIEETEYNILKETREKDLLLSKKLLELDSKSTQYINENIGDETHQLKYLGRFSELQEKRIDGIELTTEEQAEKDALKELHRRYKAILVEYNVMKSAIENNEDIDIIFTE